MESWEEEPSDREEEPSDRGEEPILVF